MIGWNVALALGRSVGGGRHTLGTTARAGVPTLGDPGVYTGLMLWDREVGERALVKESASMSRKLTKGTNVDVSWERERTKELKHACQFKGRNGQQQQSADSLHPSTRHSSSAS